MSEIKIKLPNYSNFFGLTHKDASEGPMLLIDTIDKEFVSCSTDNYIADRDSLADLLF